MSEQSAGSASLSLVFRLVPGFPELVVTRPLLRD